MVNKVTSEARKIKFRDSNYCVDSGGRMSQIVEEIDFDADEFIKAMRDALEAEVKKSGKSIEDRHKEDSAAAEKRAEQIAAVEESNKKEKELNEIKAKIKDFCIANKGKAAALKPLLALAKEKGYENPMAVDDIDVAKEILALTAA